MGTICTPKLSEIKNVGHRARLRINQGQITIHYDVLSIQSIALQ